MKVVLIILGGLVMAFCIFAIPMMSRGVGIEWPQLTHLKYPILIGGYLTALPFFVALYQAFKLLTYIDRSIAFSDVSVRALRSIKYCGITMSILYAASTPIVFQIAEADDAPGAVLFWMLFALAPAIVAVFAAVLQKLVENAIDIKSENDLTV